MSVATRKVGIILQNTQRRETLKQAQIRIGYRFKDLSLLDQALTHSSVDCSDSESLDHYELMEFLGDSVLGLIVTEALYRRFPETDEGGLSKMKGFLVSARQLAQMSQALDLGAYLVLGSGEDRSGGRHKRAILADLFESVLGAIYLDGGLEPARCFVLAQLEPVLRRLDSETVAVKDFKSTLQERLHRLGRREPHYQVVNESGPDHQRQFVIEVRSRDEALGKGAGPSKKEAGQAAARAALDRLTRRRKSRAKEVPVDH